MGRPVRQVPGRVVAATHRWAEKRAPLRRRTTEEPASRDWKRKGTRRSGGGWEPIAGRFPAWPPAAAASLGGRSLGNHNLLNCSSSVNSRFWRKLVFLPLPPSR